MLGKTRSDFDDHLLFCIPSPGSIPRLVLGPLEFCFSFFPVVFFHLCFFLAFCAFFVCFLFFLFFVFYLCRRPKSQKFLFGDCYICWGRLILPGFPSLFPFLCFFLFGFIFGVGPELRACASACSPGFQHAQDRVQCSLLR